MKKIVVMSITLIVLCLLPIIAMAANCPDHPNAKTYYAFVICEEHSVVKHKTLYGVHCSECGELVRDVYEFGWHNYSGTKCKDCGYTKPAKDQLNNDVLQLGETIRDRELWVLYQAGIYDDVNGSQVTQAQPNEQYYVMDYQNYGDKVWIQVRPTTSQTVAGWMKAENTAVSARADVENAEDLVGMSFRITASSGRGRTGAGTEYAYIETVHYGEEYIILDTATASNGTTWFKLKVSGQECWVSSGLGTWK